MAAFTDAMRQYERSTDEILKNKPKRSKEYGIRRPDSINIISALSGLFVIGVVISEMI
jgi:hypothetical protein